MNNLKTSSNYKTIIENSLKNYIDEYGRLKFDKVISKVQNSKKITNLLSISLQKHIVPNKNDYLYSLSEIPYFIFSKPDTLAIAGILCLERWNQDCNKDFYLADENELIKIALDILKASNHLKFVR
ncbi:MAG: hypothetical protein WC069_06685 [Candidatus Shapirobacteria bacterium]